MLILSFSGRVLAVRVTVIHADSRDALRDMADASVDSVVTDPPYGLNFMGKRWDGGDAAAFDPAFWAEVLRVLKPGGHCVAFGGTRTYHRLVCAIEDGGFEIRDQLAWIFGSGFPKSFDVSKGIDRAAGAERESLGEGAAKCEFLARGEACPGHGDHNGRYGETVHAPNTAPATDAARQWAGWGSALKPAHEPICLARKPLIGTIAANVLAHGTGALNIDACRIETAETLSHGGRQESSIGYGGTELTDFRTQQHEAGRWPANVIHDGSPEVLRGFPETGASSDAPRNNGEFKSVSKGAEAAHTTCGHADNGGSAARFFYTAKADAGDRLESRHPTVKPVDLMAYLVRLITPPNGVVLDPFAGSGATGMACMREGFDCILIERELEYVTDIKRRIAHVHGHDAPLFAELAP